MPFLKQTTQQCIGFSVFFHHHHTHIRAFWLSMQEILVIITGLQILTFIFP